MDTAPEPTSPEAINESVLAITRLAVTLAEAAAILDPQNETVYYGVPPGTQHTPPAPESRRPSIWQRLSKWRTDTPRTQSQPAAPPVLLWYVASHPIVTSCHYYVEKSGVLYTSLLKHPVNGVVEVVPLTTELLTLLSADDHEHLLYAMEQQHVQQRIYLDALAHEEEVSP